MITEKEAKSALALTREELLLGWYDSELRRTTGIGYDEAQGFREDFLASFERWCSVRSVKTKICDEWNYCQKLKEHKSQVDLVLALASFILGAFGVDAAESLCAAVLVVREEVGVACECDE